MKNKALILSLLSFLFASCGDDTNSPSNSNEESEKRINTTILGMAQGPFEEGSSVSVYELDTNFQKTGYNIETEIINEHGEYSINVKNFKFQYALLKVEGNLRDICTEKKTANKTTLYALTDLSNTKANINILTHLAHKRALYLVTKKNMTVAKAKKQAEAEVLKSFNIEENLEAAENIDIFTDTKQNWPLLSISALMQSDLANRGVKDFLADYVSDIEKDGTWDDKNAITKIADWAYERSKKSWSDLESKIPVNTSAIEKYMNKFWQNNYNLGNCTNKQNNLVKKNNNPVSNEANTFFICKSGTWKEIQKDDIIKYYYTDTLHIDSSASDGAVYWDKEYSVCYVYEDSLWIKINKTNCMIGLSGCTKLRKNDAEQDSSNHWYICDGREWISMDDCETIKKKGLLFEKDIQNWKDSTEGAIRKGDITDIIYIFNNKKWRVATLPEASLGGCNEKTVGNFGYAEERQGQDMIEPRGYECVVETHSSECPSPSYFPSYYICEKSYDNKFYWETIDYRGYNSICNNRSDDTNSQEVNTYWGNFAPAKKKCVNCKQENIDHFEDQCKKRCYASGYIAHASACALGFGGCTKDLYGTLKEGPSIKVGTESIYERYENYYQLSYLISIDSTKKTTYICRSSYNYDEPSYPPDYGWDVASDFDLDALPTICTLDIDGQIVVGKKNTYVCEDGRLRVATPVEIDAGFACTMYMGDSGNCKGEIISGKNNKYVCDELGFRYATQEEIETGIACSSCIILNGISCNTETEKEFGKTCTELKSIVEKCRSNE